MLKTLRNRLKIKNNDRFLSNTGGITLLHSMFDVLTINGNPYWKRGGIDLKSKRLNSFMVNNSSLSSSSIISSSSNIPLQFIWQEIIYIIKYTRDTFRFRRNTCLWKHGLKLVMVRDRIFTTHTYVVKIIELSERGNIF